MRFTFPALVLLFFVSLVTAQNQCLTRRRFKLRVVTGRMVFPTLSGYLDIDRSGFAGFNRTIQTKPEYNGFVSVNPLFIPISPRRLKVAVYRLPDQLGAAPGQPLPGIPRKDRLPPKHRQPQPLRLQIRGKITNRECDERGLCPEVIFVWLAVRGVRVDLWARVHGTERVLRREGPCSKEWIQGKTRD
jgi:hypothetical protein